MSALNYRCPECQGNSALEMLRLQGFPFSNWCMPLYLWVEISSPGNVFITLFSYFRMFNLSRVSFRSFPLWILCTRKLPDMHGIHQKTYLSLKSHIALHFSPISMWFQHLTLAGPKASPDSTETLTAGPMQWEATASTHPLNHLDFKFLFFSGN